MFHGFLVIFLMMDDFPKISLPLCVLAYLRHCILHRRLHVACPNSLDLVLWDIEVLEISSTMVCMLDVHPYARLYACIPELALLPLQSDDGNLDDLLSQGKLCCPQTSQMHCKLLCACVVNISMLLYACGSARLACNGVPIA